MNRKTFLTSIGIISTFPLLTGCNTLNWTNTDMEKLAMALEQAGFVLATKFRGNSSAKKYLEISITTLESVIADGKIDPTDIISIIIANIKNDDVVVGLTSALLIYKIWWNDALPSTTQGIVIISSLIQGLKKGLIIPSLKTTSVPQITIPSFTSKSLNNAVKDFFKRYN